MPFASLRLCNPFEKADASGAVFLQDEKLSLGSVTTECGGNSAVESATGVVRQKCLVLQDFDDLGYMAVLRSELREISLRVLYGSRTRLTLTRRCDNTQGDTMTKEGWSRKGFREGVGDVVASGNARDWSLARQIEDSLSQSRGVGDVTGTVMPRKRVRSQHASFAPSDAPMYSASVEDRLTTFCFREDQDITPDPSEKV
ncbi:hypothetical protein B0H15DRAFT_802757 [Mycena belliarum]|uniref:Uncharacterized protein n=1 Tax=Mycena belliarum TaxID=1033014 RepID=A0AAD6XS91_9AGAR|nr:hypothetical protein B0H15DRAFT_802757 [Mycena belliae]